MYKNVYLDIRYISHGARHLSTNNKIMEYIEIGKKEGRLMTGGEGDDSKGFFIQPNVLPIM